MLAANRLVLDTIEARIEGELVDSQVDGRVVIEAGRRLERCAVRGPAIIGAGARLTDCYVGPYTAVGDGCTIQHAEVEHSILLAGSSVRDLDGRMESSLLGATSDPPRSTASRTPTASWSATTPRSGSLRVRPTGALLDQPGPDRIGHCRSSIRDAQLPVDVREVGLDG